MNLRRSKLDEIDLAALQPAATADPSIPREVAVLTAHLGADERDGVERLLAGAVVTDVRLETI